MNTHKYLKQGAIVPVTMDAIRDLVELGKQQADRIAELEQAIKDADEWLESGEGVSLCYYAFSDSNPNSIKIIKEITG